MYLTSLLCIIFLTSCHSLDLTELNVTFGEYVSSAAIYKNRIFICIPVNEVSNESKPGLIEIPWNDGGKTKPKAFPDDIGPSGSCNGLINSTSVDTDLRNRLWVLDRGNDTCSAKVVVYNLHYNSELQSCDLRGVLKSRLNYIVVDPYVNQWGTKAYISSTENGEVIVYSLKERRWWKLLMVSKSGLPVVCFTLSVARKEPVMYINKYKSYELYSVQLHDIRKSAGPPAIIGHETAINITVRLVGEVLGMSSALIADQKGGLLYYLVRDYAIVRWDTKKPLIAESHDVLLQSAEIVPYVTQFIFDPQGNIWALANPSRPGIIDSQELDSEELKGSRLVKILKTSVNF